MTLHRFMAVLLAIALGVVGGGCDSKPKESKRARVSGKVLFEGKPLKNGSITFDPQNGEPPSVMDILEGNYEGKAIIGKNKVTLSALHKISMKEKMKMDGPGYDTMVEENMLPPRFNSQSQIFREVEAGENTFNFETSAK